MNILVVLIVILLIVTVLVSGLWQWCHTAGVASSDQLFWSSEDTAVPVQDGGCIKRSF